jgi:hypothetical protein
MKTRTAIINRVSGIEVRSTPGRRKNLSQIPCNRFLAIFGGIEAGANG